MKTKIFAIISTLLLAIFCCIGLCSCNKTEKVPVDYSGDMNFDIKIVEDDNYKVFEPISSDGKQVDYKYGVIFYLGTMISEDHYDYLGNALSKQGYLVVMPKIYLAYFQYKDVEEAFNRYPNVKFFVGGHSQGGGAAIRRAQENEDRVAGAILFAPLALRHQLFDKDGKPVVNEDGVDVYINDNLHDLQLPTLLIEASNDHVLTDAFKADALSRLNLQTTTKHMIDPGSHMSFSTNDKDETLKAFNNDGDGITQEQKDEQRRLTVEYTLAFLKSVVTR